MKNRPLSMPPVIDTSQPTCANLLVGEQMSSLRRQWWFACYLLFIPWLHNAVCWWQFCIPQPWALITLLPGLAVAIHLLHHLRSHLNHNHPPAEVDFLFPTLGAANWITLLRGSGVVTLAGLLPFAIPTMGELQGLEAWAPGVLYLLIALADLLDGYLARKSGRVTELGRSLDMTTDAAGLLTASLLAIAQNRLPLPYLLVGVAFYPFTLGLRFRQRRSLPVAALTYRPYSRFMAGFHMALVGVALLPLIDSSYLTIAAYLAMIPFLVGFLRDWLVVSCRLKTDALQQTAWDQPVANFWTERLPLFCRLSLLCTMLLLLAGQRFPHHFDCWQILASLGAALAVVGVLGRFSALLLALIIALELLPAITPLQGHWLFAVSLTLALTGCGPYTLWSPEDAILSRQQHHN